jgi:hypothetical protein
MTLTTTRLMLSNGKPSSRGWSLLLLRRHHSRRRRTPAQRSVELTHQQDTLEAAVGGRTVERSLQKAGDGTRVVTRSGTVIGYARRIVLAVQPKSKRPLLPVPRAWLSRTGGGSGVGNVHCETTLLWPRPYLAKRRRRLRGVGAERLSASASSIVSRRARTSVRHRDVRQSPWRMYGECVIPATR